MPEPGDMTEVRVRARVRRDILTCTACPLHEHTTPTPFTGRPPVDFVVLGEAPGRNEHHHGKPFVGASGRLLRRLLRKAGLNPAKALICNTVSCYPRGTPSTESLHACRSHMLAQLALTDRPILACGQTALEALIPDGRISDCHGYVFLPRISRLDDVVATPRVVMPVYHPAFLLRRDGGYMTPKVVEALEAFYRVVKMDSPLPVDYKPDCMVCGVTADMWDNREVPYCNRHIDHIEKRHRKEKRHKKAVAKAAQTRLEL